MAGGDDVAKAALVADVTLALHAEAGNAVPGQLGQQHPADAFCQKGKGGVFQHAFVAHIHQSFQKALLILPGHLLHQRIHITAGIAQSGAQGHQCLTVRGMFYQNYSLGALRHGSSLLNTAFPPFSHFRNP